MPFRVKDFGHDEPDFDASRKLSGIERTFFILLLPLAYAMVPIAWAWEKLHQARRWKGKHAHGMSPNTEN